VLSTFRKWPLKRVTRETVYLGYLLLLGRAPENSSVLEEKSRRVHNLFDLREEFISGYEFRIKNRAVLTPEVTKIDRKDPPPDEAVVEYFERLKSEWTLLGDSDPYWSVLSSEKFSGKLDSEKLEEFYASGALSVSHFLTVCEFNGIEIPDKPKILELGCGVGRITKSLTKLSDSILAVDVSLGNLTIAKSIDYGACKVDFMLLDTLNKLDEINGSLKIFFTVITLQHNPPPVQIAILKKIFSLFNIPGSILYFQTVTHITERGKRTLEATSTDTGTFGTYAIPMGDVLNCINEANLEIFDLHRDDFQLDPDFHSYSFFVRRPTVRALEII